MSQPFSIPREFEEFLEKRLQQIGFSLAKPQELAENIRLLSNLFLRGGVQDQYWKEKKYHAAYIAYFATLNFLRASAVFDEARRREFLDNIKSLSDWGSGAGSALWAFSHEFKDLKNKITIQASDRSSEALEELQHWLKFLEIKAQVQKSTLKDVKNSKADTFIFSYVLNELEAWPELPATAKNLILIEPSTHQAGRKLLEWRDELLQNGWYAWAPCTHQDKCPLYHLSGKDWCHHRIQWIKPSWFLELERHLPMRNDTLTLSYLLLSKSKPKHDLKGIARVVGDEQEEKGKSRQLICRDGTRREFLSWLHRDQISLKLKRGDLVKIDGVEVRQQELRVIAPHLIEILKP